MSFNPTQTTIKPVYGVNDYGQDISINLSQDNLPLRTFTYSSATIFARNVSSTVFPIEDLDYFISDVNTWSIMNEADNTAFDRIYQWEPDMSAFVYKTSLAFAVGLNVSAFTTGSYDLTGVRVVIDQFDFNGNKIFNIFDRVFTATLTAITATGTLVFIVIADDNTAIKVLKGQPIRINIIVNETTGTGTRQVGILPVFSLQSTNTTKIFYPSVIKFHVHASLDHPYPVFSDEGSQDRLDYSGLNRDGSKL